MVKVSQFPLFVGDTIGANLRLAKADATDAQLEEVCRRTGLWQVLEQAAGPEIYPLDYHLPKASSEGLHGAQRRLLSVTRAFLLHPTILLLDEPTTGIDPIGRGQLAAILRDICQGLTVLLVDHDVAFISQFADYICCLEQGKFTEVGSVAELVSRPGLFRVLLEENAFYCKGPGSGKAPRKRAQIPEMAGVARLVIKPRGANPNFLTVSDEFNGVVRPKLQVRCSKIPYRPRGSRKFRRETVILHWHSAAGGIYCYA